VSNYTSGGTLTSHVNFVYDIYDRLIGKQVDPTGGGTYTSSQWFVYDAGTHTYMVGNGVGWFGAVHNASPGNATTGAERLVMSADTGQYTAEEIAAQEKQIYTGDSWKYGRYVRGEVLPSDKSALTRVEKIALTQINQGFYSERENFIGYYDRGTGYVWRNGEKRPLADVLYHATNGDNGYKKNTKEAWDEYFRPIEDVNVDTGALTTNGALMTAGGNGSVDESKRTVKLMLGAMATHVGVATAIQYGFGPAGGKLIGFAAGKTGGALSAVFKVGSGKGGKYVTKELTEAETTRVIQAIEMQALGKDPALAAEAKKALTELSKGNGKTAQQAARALDSLAGTSAPKGIPKVGQSHPDLPVRKNRNDPTHGTFNDKQPLVSGTRAETEAVFRSRIGQLSDKAIISLTHVEGHAAAEMVENKMKEAVLHINYETGPCPNCVSGVPELLEEGQKLWVVYPDGVGYFTNKGWFPQ
jgi:hypothetical protein